MKRFAGILLPLIFLTFNAVAQVYTPVKWKFTHKLVGDDQAQLSFTATIDEHWHVYSTQIEDGIGPVPTMFDFQKVEGAKLVGNIAEPKPHKEYDPNFEMELLWFEKQVTFTQMVKLTGPKSTISGELTYMTCDDSKCLPPDYLEFKFDIEAPIKPAGKSATASNPVENNIKTPVKWTFKLTEKGDGIYTLTATAMIDEHWHVYSTTPIEGDGPVATEFNFTGGSHELLGEFREKGTRKQEYDENFMMDLKFYEDKMVLEQDFKFTGNENITGYVYFMTCDAQQCLPPEELAFEIDANTKTIIKGDITPDSDTSAENLEENSTESGEDRSLWGIFFLSFLGGFAALLTPCVFPMIPMTVSFFTKQSKTKAKGIRNAITYGLFIVGIYTLLGLLVTITFGADALNALSTNVIFNLAFFVILVVFGISFLGAFEITLPSSFVNKVDQQSDRGGLVGIFFMAFTLSLVSFSCTGPIIGTLLVEAAVHGGISGPLVGMGGFSLALALPFALFAAFPGWMNSLPKSGGWLNSVKVVLGFLEIGLAFKFLSNADLVVQGGYLQREVFIAIWIATSALITLYLLGFIRMPHDSPLEKISVFRALMGMLFFMFTVYLVPGMWGAPLKLISGFPPPMFYSESPNGVGGSGGAVAHASITGEVIPEGADPSHCPHNLNCFHDYETGMAYAKKVNKPVMLDFTGWACVNCRKMEESVWSDPRVLEILRDDIVLISLYVDEKTELPKEEQYVSELTGKKIKTVGNKWADFQIKYFHANAQPQYAILNHTDIAPLNGTTSYDPDIELYHHWLEEGIAKFEAQKK